MKKETVIIVLIVLFSGVSIYWFFFRKHESCGMHMQKTMGTLVASASCDTSCKCSVGGVCNCIEKHGVCHCDKTHKTMA